MAGSLKEGNKWALLGVAAVNLAVFFGAVEHDTILRSDWLGLVKEFGSLMPAGVGLALVGIINAQLSAEAKARIVFLRWNDALPGCEAFSHYAHTDPRVDVAALDRMWGPLPTDPKKQNVLWYKLYKSVEDHPSVAQVHKAYLFARDYACIALMMLAVLGLAGFVFAPSLTTALGYSGVLLAQVILAGQAGRNHGKRFVTTVLALKGAEGGPSRG